jgi:hypothetical protein
MSDRTLPLSLYEKGTSPILGTSVERSNNIGIILEARNGKKGFTRMELGR